MNCCRDCNDIFNKTFDQKLARKDLASYRKRGTSPSTKKLVGAIKHFENGSLSEKSLLDIGGGIGAIGLDLAKLGVSTVVNLDASSSYLELAKEEVHKNEHQGKFHFIEGVIAEMDDEINEADIVTLDKVICCNQEYHRLVKTSLLKSKQLYGIVIPRDVWWVSSVNYIGNLFRRITGNTFNTYVHPVVEIEDLIVQSGFKKIFDEVAREWQIQLFERH